MKREPQDDMLLRSYLLGELRDEEADGLEQRLLEDDELFELAEAVEADLLAAVDRGDLAPAERERVLSRLASSPQGRERFALARSLNAVADEEAVVVPFRRRSVFPLPAIRWVALAASLLMVTGLSWFAWRNREHAPIATDRVVVQAPTPAPPWHAPAVTPGPSPSGPPAEKTPKPVAPQQPQHRATPPVDVLTLTLMGLRGADEEVAKLQKLHLSPGSHLAELQIDLDGNEAKSFAVAIYREERTIWEKALKPVQRKGGPVLVVDVPAEVLSAGRYKIAITAEGESEEMSQEFEVVQTNR